MKRLCGNLYKSTQWNMHDLHEKKRAFNQHQNVIRSFSAATIQNNFIIIVIMISELFSSHSHAYVCLRCNFCFRMCVCVCVCD